MTRLKKLRLLEFVLIGVIMGTAEDLIAVIVATDASFTFEVFLTVLAVAVPFAFISEVVVDHPKFWEKIFPVRGVKNEIKDIEEKLEEVVKK